MTRRVFGRSAAAKAEVSVWSTKVTSIPRRGATSLRRLSVPPYMLCWATTWSPVESSASSVVEIAPMPEAVASAASAPSAAARTFSSRVWVGLP